MSVSTHTIRPLANQFTAIFNAASNEYQRLTGQSLDSHPFAAQLEACESPEAVSNILRAQTQAFNKDKEGDKKLMTWLDPTIRIMFAFSYSIANLVGVPFPPARGIFIGFVVLFVATRDAVARYIMLVDLLERIHFFLQRLNCYTEVPLTKEFVELLGKIMAQLLLILALSTKEMKQSRIIRLFKRLVGNEDVEDALLRLDRLTRAESLMVAVKGMETMYHLKRNQFRGELRKWLAAPDPSINHNAACETQHRGSTRWFTQGSTFLEWKESASLLWICGNPGAGKTILCSAIIEDIKNMRQARSALIAYFYFDFKDSSKRDLRGLMFSLSSTPITVKALNNPVTLPLHDVLKACSDLQDKFQFFSSWMRWTSVRVQPELHLLAKKFWTSLWNYSGRIIPICTCA
ncbi:hypothetical protein F5148DRAFT_268232 [Russula earlei]|uniref:Uncharacterized protein n=1 Tax=Russula earlei TaxID=71964 RepID=A0ACC0U4I2_9AGAM|nr:hypothetical protein F5148DRAFT_268232 [Russula earlei]